MLVPSQFYRADYTLINFTKLLSNPLTGSVSYNYPWGKSFKVQLPNELKPKEFNIIPVKKANQLIDGFLISIPHVSQFKREGILVLRLNYKSLFKFPNTFQQNYQMLKSIILYDQENQLFTKDINTTSGLNTKQIKFDRLNFGKKSFDVSCLIYTEDINYLFLFVKSLAVALFSFFSIYQLAKVYLQREIDLEIKTRIRTHQISRYKRIFHVSQDALIVLGDMDRVILSNNASQKMFGYSEVQLEQLTVGELFPDLKRESFKENFSRNFRNYQGGRYKVRELMAKRANGEMIPCSVSTARFKYYLWDQYIVIIRDISEMVLFRQDLEKKNEDLKLLDQSKNSFLSNVTHELRTPLTAIISGANMLNRTFYKKSRGEDESICDRFNQVKTVNEFEEKDIARIQKISKSIDNFVPIISKEAQRLLEMVNDVLDLAKIEAGKIDIHYNYCKLNKLIDRAYTSFKGMAEEKERVFTHDQIGDNFQVYIDENRILQVIQNLINNAIKFSEKGNHIHIVCETIDNKVKIGVKDDGIGISEDDQKRIFDRFSQVESAQKGKPKGTGLGLSISKHLLNKNGSQLKLESAPGQGSTFYFYLAIQNPEMKTAIECFNKEELYAG